MSPGSGTCLAKMLKSINMGNQDHRQKRRAPEPLRPVRADALRAERLRDLLEELIELNAHTPVIVEGKRDREALRTLGLTGEIITYNQGKGVHDFCEHLAEEHGDAVLLMDWDREGEALFAKLAEGLGGLWEEHARFRKFIRLICQKEIKDVEGLPALMRRLEAGLVEETLIEDGP